MNQSSTLESLYKHHSKITQQTTSVYSRFKQRRATRTQDTNSRLVRGSAVPESWIVPRISTTGGLRSACPGPRRVEVPASAALMG